MSVIDPTSVAAGAGLRHVDPSKLPIIRRRRGNGFSYVDRDGRKVSDRMRSRIEALVIPPAWQDVRIASDDRAHIQAIGVDADGRTQYRYHETFREAAEAAKFARLGSLGEAVPRLRKQVVRRLADCDAAERPPEGDVAAVIGLIDHTLMRVGSHRYADEHESFGASSLRRRHVCAHPDGVRLMFTAKSGIERDIVITDQMIAGPVLRCHARGKRRDDLLFCGPEGGAITGDAVAETLSEWAGLPMSAKDLRTWGASAAMIAELMEPDLARGSDSDDPILAAYDGVAERLGNTRDIARSSYVAPRVIESYETGDLQKIWSGCRSSSVFSRAEQCSRKLFSS
jgi:DNA topoisomerase-1